MEYRTVPFHMGEKGYHTKKAEDGKQLEVFRFEGYAATWDIDLINDQIMPGAFKKSIAKKLPKLWDTQELTFTCVCANLSHWVWRSELRMKNG